MTDINQLRSFIIEAVNNAQDVDLLDLIFKLLVAESR